MGKREAWDTVGQNADVTASVEDSMEVPQKLKLKLSYDPASPLLGMYLDKTVI